MSLYTYRAIVAAPPYDADTIDLDIDLGLGTWRHGERIRLYGVDAYEVRRNKARGVDAEHVVKGKAARDVVRSILWPVDVDYYDRNDGGVAVETPRPAEVIVQTILDRSGKYGRLLGVIWVPLKSWPVNLPNESGRSIELGDTCDDVVQVLSRALHVNLNAWLIARGHAVPMGADGSKA